MEPVFLFMCKVKEPLTFLVSIQFVSNSRQSTLCFGSHLFDHLFLNTTKSVTIHQINVDGGLKCKKLGFVMEQLT